VLVLVRVSSPVPIVSLSCPRVRVIALRSSGVQLFISRVSTIVDAASLPGAGVREAALGVVETFDLEAECPCEACMQDALAVARIVDGASP
jgi:hypothetical protein